MNQLTKPSTSKWLIAAWPGMGNVSVVAAGYLVQQLGFQVVAELSLRGRFDLSCVQVGDGLIAPPQWPRGLFFRHPNPAPGQDFTIFLGEAQPTHGGYEFAHELLETAKQFGIERVVTFASLASQNHPSQPSRVLGAATTPGLLDELTRVDVQKIETGQIGGLNGVLLGAAAERGIPGVCLMGEIPIFAAGIVNPKAAGAVLGAFSAISGIALDLQELNKQGAKIDKALIKMLEKAKDVSGETGEGDGLTETTEIVDAPESPAPPAISTREQVQRKRIEELFEAARKDHSRVSELKQELDRHRLFRKYENRFLDLFKRAA